MRAMAIAVFPNQAREARYLVKQKCHQFAKLTLVFDNLDPRAGKLCTGKLLKPDGKPLHQSRDALNESLLKTMMSFT